MLHSRYRFDYLAEQSSIQGDVATKDGCRAIADSLKHEEVVSSCVPCWLYIG